MMTSIRALLAAGVATALLGGTAFAGATKADASGVDRLPSYSGTVQHFTITPRGDIDGIILSNGQDVNFPPYLSTQIAYAVKLGDQVTVHGLKAASEPVVQGVSITDTASHRTVTDNGPAGFGRHKHAALQRMMLSGKIAQDLYGPDGAANGVLLDDGTAVHMPPPEAIKFANLLKPGKEIAIVGAGTRNDLGRVVMARKIGTSFNDMQTVAFPPPGPHGEHHRGPHGGPMGWHHHGPHGMMGQNPPPPPQDAGAPAQNP